MSDNIDWRPVAMWSACVGIQASSAIYNWWTTAPGDVLDEEAEAHRIRERERRLFEYGRIERGVKMFGWKSCKFGYPGDDFSKWQLISPLWPKDGDDATVDSSVLVHKQNRESYIIRRYSLIAPGLYDDIVQILYNESFWWPSTQCWIDESVVAIGWEQIWSNEIRIVLVDVNSRTYQILETTSPQQEADICTISRYSSNGNLLVLFRVQDDVDGHIKSFHLGEYEISSSESVHSPIVRQLYTRRLDWPQGNWSFSSTFPGVFYLMSDANGDDDLLRVISFDRHGIHDYGSQSDWISKFDRTTIGVRNAKAKDALEKMMPVGEDVWIGQFEMHRSQLFAYIEGNSYMIVHHPLSIPSLTYLSAEATCLAIPNRNIADVDWRKEVGFDFTGGILEGKPPAVIRM